jgi:hypothetical protein
MWAVHDTSKLKLQRFVQFVALAKEWAAKH